MLHLGKSFRPTDICSEILRVRLHWHSITSPHLDHHQGYHLIEYRDEVDHMIKEMLDEGIIEESSSPWMAPAVYVRKKDGSIRLCVDYRTLNKQTVKDAYPLPLPDEVQDHLAGSTIYSTLDLQSGYWQIPVHPTDYEKTAFCPGPGLGLFQFRRKPFGLSGAAGSFQRLMDKVFQGLNFVKAYVHDVFIYSGTKDEHVKHLTALFQCLKDAGLSLRGNKCHIGLSKVCYLGHIFSAKGMMPDDRKVIGSQGLAYPNRCW